MGTTMQSNINKQPEQKLLKSWIHVAAIADEFPECTYTAEKVYSYMLCKYIFFSKRNQTYFESQEEISRGARASVAPTKLAIKWLREIGLIIVTKKKGSLHFNNQYVVHDRYGIYQKNETVVERQHKQDWVDEDGAPF